MTRKDYSIMLGMVVLSGLIGGSLTSLLVSGTVFAGTHTKPAKVLQAETLQIVDGNGQVRIELSVKSLEQPKRPRRSDTYNLDGNARVAPASTGIDPIYFQPRPRIQIINGRGQIIWAVPTDHDAMFVR